MTANRTSEKISTGTCSQVCSLLASHSATALLALSLVATSLSTASATEHAIDAGDELTIYRAGNVYVAQHTYGGNFLQTGNSCGAQRIVTDDANNNGRNFFLYYFDNNQNSNCNESLAGTAGNPYSWDIRGISAHVAEFDQPTIRALAVGEGLATHQVLNGISLNTWDNDSVSVIVDQNVTVPNGAVVGYEITLADPNVINVGDSLLGYRAGNVFVASFTYGGNFLQSGNSCGAQRIVTDDANNDGRNFFFYYFDNVNNSNCSESLAGTAGNPYSWNIRGISNHLAEFSQPTIRALAVGEGLTTYQVPNGISLDTWDNDSFSVVVDQSVVVPNGAIVGYEITLPLAPVDGDGDGIEDAVDNCPIDFNPNQENLDEDSLGDVCDPDDDGDGVDDASDNCPVDTNTDQVDFDGDGAGDACDTDDDNDSVADAADFCTETPLGSAVDANGCSGEQSVALACSNHNVCDFRNNGQYQQCVVHAANAARSSGLLSNKQRADIVRAAAKNRCD